MESDRKAKSYRRKSLKGVGDQCCARPPSEDTIWQSEVILKKASGKRGHPSAVFPTCEIEAPLQRVIPNLVSDMSFFLKL